MRFLAGCFLLAVPVWGMTLSFASLPSAQSGWTLTATGLTESGNISLAGGVLSLNSVGSGSGFAWYEFAPVETTGSSFLVFEARSLATETDEFGWAFGVYSAGAAYVVGLGQGYVKAYQGSTALIDTTAFQTYVMEVNHDTLSYTLSNNGGILLSGSGIASAGEYVAFGDLSTAGNGQGELRYLSYGTTAILPDTGIPEPDTWCLFAAGCLAIWALKRNSS